MVGDNSKLALEATTHLSDLLPILKKDNKPQPLPTGRRREIQNKY